MERTQPVLRKTLESGLQKSCTGIKGLDQVLEGGLPEGRTALVCGNAGAGKTLLAGEFLARGATQYNEPGVFMAFEETAPELFDNMASLGIDLQDLTERNMLFIDHIHIDRSEIEETGEYDLDGLFIRLASAIEMIGAKRVVLDTIEAIFAGFSDEGVLRSELRRLFRWLKDRGVTTIVTAERGEGMLTRHGLEEYVSDCVILLDNRVHQGIATRRLRVIKYRGSKHGNDEYPFLIGDQGIWVLPVTSIGLDYPVSRDFISSGIPRLDEMLGRRGFYKGTSILVTGMAGTGKTSLAAHMVDAACRRGERCLFFSFEESSEQIIRNMNSIGLDLQQWVDQGLLQFHVTRPSFFGAEMHLLTIQKATEAFNPNLVVLDPVNDLSQVSTAVEVKNLMIRMIDYFKSHAITAVFTSLIQGEQSEKTTDMGISSLMDTWIVLTMIESYGERNRAITVLKSRGMAHSNQMREFQITGQGIEILAVQIGPEGILTGTARLQHKAEVKAEALERNQTIEFKKRDLERKRKIIQTEVETLQAQIEAEEDELQRLVRQEQQRREIQVETNRALKEVRETGEPQTGKFSENQERKS